MRTMVCRAVLLATAVALALVAAQAPPASAETNNQPLLAWAGQRIVLEHDWSFTDIDGTRTCPFAPGGEGDFLVRHVKEAGNGALIDDLGSGAASGPDFMVVRVEGEGDSNTDANANCISRVIYEAQDQGVQDVVAHVVECTSGGGGYRPRHVHGRQRPGGLPGELHEA